MEFRQMRRWFAFAMLITFAASPAYSATRFNCAVDDSNIKLNLDAGFDTKGGHKLNHFRGAMISKATSVPEGFRKLLLDSNQLMQSWSSDKELRLEVYAQNGENDADNNFDLVVMADGKSSPMQGSYVLNFAIADSPQPLQFTGRLSCSTQ
jgi:hypothetical protein